MSDFAGIVFILCFLALIGMMMAWQIAYWRVGNEIKRFNANRPVDSDGLTDPGKPQMF
jgi:hypothetical protein